MKPNKILLVSAALALGIYGCSDEGGGNNPGGSGGAGGAGGDPITGNGGSGGAGGVAGTAGGGISGSGGMGGGFDAGMPDGGMPDDADMQGDSGAPSASCDLSGGTEPLEPLSDDVALPIVFVHGYAGSAQQFQSQAQRYVANGYPADRLFAYDHDGEGSDTAGYADGVDELIDEVLSRFDQFDQVYLMGHSRGTMTSFAYLGDSARADKVAKYVSLDGWPCLGIPVECLALGQADYEGQLHVEVATSPESFADQYEFFVGEAPEVVDIQPQVSPIRISGRAVDFPANTGKDGTTLRIWEIDSETGQRVKDAPEATFEIGPDGSWGPAEGLCPKKHYEMELAGLGSGATQHFYPQPFLRDSQFVRLLSGPPDSESRQNTNSGPGHSALIAMRMREWTQDDVLRVGVQSESGNQEPENVITSDVADGNIALYLHDDAASPQETTLDLLPWFPDQSFQSGVDIYLPAADPPDGTITLENLPRGDESLPQVLNVPNWPSDSHTITVYFRDYPQDFE